MAAGIPPTAGIVTTKKKKKSRHSKRELITAPSLAAALPQLLLQQLRMAKQGSRQHQPQVAKAAAAEVPLLRADR
jgi:hypothetical protein